MCLKSMLIDNDLVRRLIGNLDMYFWESTETLRINRFFAKTSQEETSQELLSIIAVLEVFVVFFLQQMARTTARESEQVLDLRFEPGEQFPCPQKKQDKDERN